VDASVDSAGKGQQLGRRIDELEMIKAALADMAADLAAGRLLVREASWLRDSGQDSARAVAIAKLFCTEAARRAADQAIRIDGGQGEGSPRIQRIIGARLQLAGDNGDGSHVAGDV
jgi:alkylation response protein AidB-like acyl-CoA dehydrogenase